MNSSTHVLTHDQSLQLFQLLCLQALLPHLNYGETHSGYLIN